MGNRREEEESKKGKEQAELFIESESHSQIGIDRINILLQQFVEASKRVRLSLITVCLAAMLLFVGVFNHQWTWLANKEYRYHHIDWPADLKNPIDPLKYFNNNDALVAALNRISENDNPKYPRHQIHELLDVEMKTVEVPVLGIQIYTEDLPVVGGVGVMILLSWFYFVRRRERGIVKLLHSIVVHANPIDKKALIGKIYSTVAFTQVFNTIQNLDSFSVKKIWNFFDSLFRKFSFTMPWIPCLIFALVICVDFLETYIIPGDKLKPRIEYFEYNYVDFNFPNPDYFKRNTKRMQTAITEFVFNKQTSFARKSFIEQIKRVKNDSILKLSIYESEKEFNKVKKDYENQIKAIKDSLYEPATTSEFLQYRAADFKEFEHKPARFGLPLTSEILWLRTIVPFFILVINVILVSLAARAARSRDFHMLGLSIENEKYFPANYNIYEVDYAYVNFYVVDHDAKPLQNVKIVAMKNHREIKTDANGNARFIELQVLNDEEFKFFFNDGVVGISKKINLTKIKRIGKIKNGIHKDTGKAISVENPFILLNRFDASYSVVEGECYFRGEYIKGKSFACNWIIPPT